MKRILIAEDNPDFIVLMREHMSQMAGYSLTEAISGNAAIKILEKEKNFDLVITDIEMKDGSGLELLQYINDGGLKIPVIIFTNDHQALSFKKSKQLIAAIIKPDFKTLKKLIRRVFEQPEVD